MKKLLIFLLAILPLTLFAQEHIQFLGHYIDEPNFVQTLISEGKVKINKWGSYESKIEGYDSFIVFNGERKINSITFTQPRSNKWETLKSIYYSYKKIFDRKYNLVSCVEKIGVKGLHANELALMKIRNGEGKFESIFTIPNGYISVSIHPDESRNSQEGQVVVTMVDTKNIELVYNTKLELIPEFEIEEQFQIVTEPKAEVAKLNAKDAIEELAYSAKNTGMIPDNVDFSEILNAFDKRYKPVTIDFAIVTYKELGIDKGIKSPLEVLLKNCCQKAKMKRPSSYNFILTPSLSKMEDSLGKVKFELKVIDCYLNKTVGSSLDLIVDNGSYEQIVEQLAMHNAEIVEFIRNKHDEILAEYNKRAEHLLSKVSAFYGFINNSIEDYEDGEILEEMEKHQKELMAFPAEVTLYEALRNYTAFSAYCRKEYDYFYLVHKGIETYMDDEKKARNMIPKLKDIPKTSYYYEDAQSLIGSIQECWETQDEMAARIASGYEQWDMQRLAEMEERDGTAEYTRQLERAGKVKLSTSEGAFVLGVLTAAVAFFVPPAEPAVQVILLILK